MTVASLAAALAAPPAPEGLAQLRARGPDGEESWSLLLYKRLPGRAIGAGPHVDPVSTAWKPDFDKGKGDVLWLVGYKLSTLNEPGDVRVTVQVLVELPPVGSGAVRAVWHEDRMQVPTELWSGAGLLDRAPVGAGAGVKLLLTSPEDGERTVEGTLWLAP